MPHARKIFRSRAVKRHRRKYGAPLNAVKWTRGKRVAQNVTRDVKWFKESRPIESDNSGEIRFALQTTTPQNAGDFTNFGIFYEEYKILQVMVKFYPAKVGSESVQNQAVGVGQPLYLRGDTCSWIDQRDDDPAPATIFDVINKSSTRIFQPRRFHKRWMSRPKGYPRWGTLNQDGTINQVDPWVASIRMFGVGFTPSGAPGNQQFFYCQCYYKVLYRNRRE